MTSFLIRLIAATAVAGALAGAATGPVHAQSSEDMVRSLQGSRVTTRSIVTPGSNADTSALIKKLQTIKTRQIVVEERKEIAKVVQQHNLPTLDLAVPFDFDSAAINPQAAAILQRLAAALKDDRLSASVFLVGGHTDARGSDGYNLDLSKRRAHSVRRYLIEVFGIAPKKLVAVGFGEEQLKNRLDPEAAENRRVQLVNLKPN